MPRAASFFSFERARMLAAPYPLLEGPRFAVRQAHLDRSCDERDLADLGRLPLHPWLVHAAKLDYKKVMASTATTSFALVATSTATADRRDLSPTPRPLKRKADDTDGAFVADMTLPEKRCRLTKEQYICRIAKGYNREITSDDEEKTKLAVALARFHELCAIDEILKAKKKERQAAVTSALVDHLKGLEDCYLLLAKDSGELDAAPLKVEPAKPKKKTSPSASPSMRRSTEELFPDDEYVPDDLADKFMTPAEIRRSLRIAARAEHLGNEAWADLSDSDDSDDSDDSNEDDVDVLVLSDDEDVKPVVARPQLPERRHKRKTYEEPIVLSDDDEPAAPANKRARCLFKQCPIDQFSKLDLTKLIHNIIPIDSTTSTTAARTTDNPSTFVSPYPSPRARRRSTAFAVQTLEHRLGFASSTSTTFSVSRQDP
ncbi:uncharacterized protein RHOBADRAFT_45773 [Rhodotorula graminis WP1]|uniref:Uncharacterized protein n=1 Tax=Rhodotorula graminis (strain WP1) TaxID=578459 RepID=A0A0P9H078_RHOGW|nr:uncharacterized protein RHOBADRAFT_45773 [Rhodotorula graminis WP1]KPV73206.1 hypothetical protein RHOBADRAFT_45773 [Rhodotorula graminis WP1]